MGRLRTLGCLLLALGLVVAGVPAPSAAQPQRLDLGQNFDTVQFRITVFPNGSAQWTVHYERILDNASEREQFESFADRFNSRETSLYRDFRNQSRALTRHGRETTGRNMTATGFERRARVVQRLNTVGVVEMSFTWTAFADVSDGRAVVGDVFEGGLYLAADQSLVIEAGEGLAFQSVDPPGSYSGTTLRDSDTVTWQGERTFTDNRPRAVLVRTAAATPPPAGGSPPDSGTVSTSTGTDTGAGPATGSSPPWGLIGVAAVLVIAAAGGLAWRRRTGGAAPASAGGPDDDAGGEVDPALSDEALMDDEERVADLLEEHGGRMRQSDIVDRTGWSKSKVSMVLSEMEEEGDVRKLRVGRENIVSLPGHEPDAAKSPHDE